MPRARHACREGCDQQLTQAPSEATRSRHGLFELEDKAGRCVIPAATRWAPEQPGSASLREPYEHRTQPHTMLGATVHLLPVTHRVSYRPGRCWKLAEPTAPPRKPQLPFILDIPTWEKEAALREEAPASGCFGLQERGQAPPPRASFLLTLRILSLCPSNF